MASRRESRKLPTLAGKFDALRHKIEYVDITTLRPHAKNARLHTKRQIKQIAQSLKRRGFVNPMIVKNNIVYIGNGRLAAAKLRGDLVGPIIRVDHLSDVEIRAFALEDNNLSDLSEFDRTILADEISSLFAASAEGFDLIGSFDPVYIDNLLGDLADPEHDPADTVLEPEKFVVSRRGDDWEFGDHYLRCGDSRSEADMAALMRGVQAHVVVGDPPYNLPTASFQGRGKIRHGNFLQGFGEMSPEEFTAFLKAVFYLMAKHSVDGSLHYYWSDWRHIVEYVVAGKAAFHEFRNIVVWDKGSPGMGSHYRSQHELLTLFKSGTAAHINNIELGRRGVRSNVWRHPGVNTFRKGRLDDLALHPTVKPVALLVDILKDASRRGDIVLDPFVGSGSTFLAAERVGRRAYGMEIDPKFVDVAIRRWQTFTGRDAVLRASGETFTEVAEIRSRSTDAVRRRR